MISRMMAVFSRMMDVFSRMMAVFSRMMDVFSMEIGLEINIILCCAGLCVYERIMCSPARQHFNIVILKLNTG